MAQDVFFGRFIKAENMGIKLIKYKNSSIDKYTGDMLIYKHTNSRFGGEARWHGIKIQRKR